MAHFRATIKGRRGPASRLGDKGSGISARVAGWDVGVDVSGHYFLGEHGPRGGQRAAWENGHNRFDISVDNGNSYGTSHNLYIGSVEPGEDGKPKFTPHPSTFPDLTEYRAMTAMVAMLLAMQAPKSKPASATIAADSAAVEIERKRRS